MRLLLAPLLVVLSVTGASPAAAQGLSMLPTGIVTTSDGRDVAAFELTPTGSLVVATERADGSFAASARTVGRGRAEGVRFSFAGGDEVVGSYEQVRSVGEIESETSFIASLGGALFAGPRPAQRALAPRRRGVNSVTVAANRRGDAAAVIRGASPQYVLTRRAGGRFGRPVAPIRGFFANRVAVAGDSGPVVAGPDERDGRLVVTAIGAGGRPEPAQHVSAGSVGGRFALAAGAGARAGVVWREPDGTLKLARRAQRGAPFGPAVEVARGVTEADGTLALALDERGGALVVRTEGGFDRAAVTAFPVAPDGRVGEPMLLSPPDAVGLSEAHLAANDRGDVVVAWPQRRARPEGASRYELVARRGTTAGAFGPLAALTQQDRDVNPSLFVSIAPSGRGSVLWSDADLTALSDRRLMVTHLGPDGAAPPVAVPWDAPLPAAMPEAAPPLHHAHLVGRRARVGSGGRLRLRVRCSDWTLAPCRGVVRLRLPDGRPAARGRFAIRPGAIARVPLWLRLGPRRVRAGRVRAVVRTAGPAGGVHRQTVVLRP